jgi:predicted lipoprotein with Yx(FWY)xxD motif
MEEIRDQGFCRLTGIGRVAGVVVALGALSVSALTVGSAAASTPSIRVTTVQTPSGRVLTVGNSTVYTLKASSTPCTAACLHVWPAVMVPAGAKHATAGSGVSSRKLGTAKLTGGGLQVTYGGQRLYTFAGDAGKGQVNGNITDTWGKWSAVVTSKSATHGSGSSSTSTSGSSSNSGSSAGSGGVSF